MSTTGTRQPKVLVAYGIEREGGRGTAVTTENVAILFTDIVGSTELSQRLSAEVADELRRGHFSILRKAVTESGGTEVKNLGDGLMGVFGSASAALACAVAMQQSVEQENRQGVEAVGLRVGLSVGEASNEDGDYFGDPVIEAARLCARCESGQILATDFVRAMAGRRSRHECRPLGELALKGLPDPVETVEVLWMPIAEVSEEFAVPLPGRIVSAVSATFVGRGAERQTLDISLKAIATGAQRTVLISGEPGIGKTSLSSGFARDAFEDGAVVLYGRCDEDLGIPYQPWAEAITHLVAHAPDELLTAHVGARGGELARLAPELVGRVHVPPSSSSDGESARYLLFGAVVDLLTRVSDIAPVVLLLDDLHWSDRQTVQLLRHVVSAEAPLRLLVIATFRESDVGTDHPLAEALAALHRESGVERLSLRGLGDDELLALLETTAGHEMTEDGVALRDALLAETEGNPFFVGEMLRHLAETQAIFQDDQGRWVTSPDLRTSGLPVSIKEVVGRRVARLGEGTQRVLSLAAVIGRDFDVDVLARAADLDEDAVIDLCDQAVTAAVLTEAEVVGRYTFAHALIEHTLYDTLSAARKARAHQRVADALEELCGDDPGERVGELAYHWAHATQPQDTTKAMEYAQKAGDRALAQLAPDEALRWYGDALDLLDRAPADDPYRHAALLLGFGDAQRQAGDPAHRETLLNAARLADDVDAIDLLVRAALRNNRGWASAIGVVDHERVEIVTRALERLGDADSPDRARLLALLCVERTYDADPDGRLALATQAVDMARRTGDKAALVDAIWRCHESLPFPRTLELRRGWNIEACEIADDLGDPTARLFANLYRAQAAIEAGDIATIRHAHSIFLSESERIGQPVNHWVNAYYGVCQLELEGDLDAAEESATKALTLGTTSGQPDAFAYYGAQLVDVRHKQGRLHELVPLIEQTVKDNPGLPAFRAALVWAKSLDAADNDVRHLLDVEIANNFPMSDDAQWLTSHVLWAEATFRCGHGPAATALYQRLLPWHAQFVTTHITVSGSVAHFLGWLSHTLERYDEADRWFGEALACHEGMEAPFFVAFTQTAWAALLIDRNQLGDAQRARSLIEAALPVATEGGYGYVERDARDVLERLA
jgi:class 3 adenylate cyclase/tetratricopeptide (TPR) repeat protein